MRLFHLGASVSFDISEDTVPETDASFSVPISLLPAGIELATELTLCIEVMNQKSGMIQVKHTLSLSSKKKRQNATFFIKVSL